VLRVARLLLCGSPVERGLAPAGERGRAGARAARVCRGAGRKRLAQALPRQGQAQPPPAGWGVLSNAPRPPCAGIQRESAQRQAGRAAVRHTVRPVTADCAPAADQNPSLLRLGRFKLQRHVCVRWRVRPADQCPFVGTVIPEKTARFCSQSATALAQACCRAERGWVECAEGFAANGTRGAGQYYKSVHTMDRCLSGRACPESARAAVLHRSHAPFLPVAFAGSRRMSVTAQASRTVEFAKYHGLGNDFIMVLAPLLPARCLPLAANCVSPPFCCLADTKSAARWTTGTRGSLCCRQRKRRACATATLASAATGCGLLQEAAVALLLWREAAHTHAAGDIRAAQRQREHGLPDAHIQLRRQRAGDVRQWHTVPGAFCGGPGRRRSLPAPRAHPRGCERAGAARSAAWAGPPSADPLPVGCMQVSYSRLSWRTARFVWTWESLFWRARGCLPPCRRPRHAPLPASSSQPFWCNSRQCKVLPLVAQGSTVVRGPLAVSGREWLMTCVSMGNPHAVTFGSVDADVKARAALHASPAPSLCCHLTSG